MTLFRKQIHRLYAMHAARLEGALRHQNDFLLEQESVRAIEEMRTELKHSQNERVLLAIQVTRLTAERNHLRDELKKAEQLLNEMSSLYEEEKTTRIAIQKSRSWRVTAPLRRFFRGG
jgi:hypothetical protein